MSANAYRTTQAYSYHTNCLWLTLINDMRFRGLSSADALLVVQDLATMTKEVFVGAQQEVRLVALRDIYQAIHSVA